MSTHDQIIEDSMKVNPVEDNIRNYEKNLGIKESIDFTIFCFITIPFLTSAVGLFSYNTLHADYILMLISSIMFVLTTFSVYGYYGNGKAFIDVSGMLTLLFVILERQFQIDYLKIIKIVLLCLTACFFIKSSLDGKSSSFDLLFFGSLVGIVCG